MRYRWGWVALVLSLASTLEGRVAYAFSSIPLDGILTNLSGLLSGDVASAVVKTFGFVFDHRPMEPATPLGTKLGLDLGVEVNLVQIPPDFSDTLSSKGIS